MIVDGSPARILIAGGGFAAVEAALALRALAGERVRLGLISPSSVLYYRPAATLEAFDGAVPRRYDLGAIAADLGATHHRARIRSVASQMRYVRTESGRELPYDALILATGARAVVGVPGALTFRDQRDGWMVARLLAELEAGAVERVVFAVPAGCAWPLPVYELAMLTAGRAQERGIDAEVSLVTPERRPLGLFGVAASRLVAGLLEKQGVRFVGAAVPTGARRDGSLTLASAGVIPGDRVVAVPELRGRRISGVPASWWGFVPTDMYGRVEGLVDVYAAGDMTRFPVKQGGLAAQQADRVAHTIAAGLGVAVKELKPRHVLRARLVGGERPIFLRTELDWTGQPTTASLEQPDKSDSASSAKIFARYLTPYLETLDAFADSQAAAG